MSNNGNIVKFSFIMAMGLLCYFNPIKAQNTGTLYGTVTEEETGEPVVGANVFLKVNGKAFGDATNNSGQYEIDSIPYGTYDITAMHIIYKK